MGGGYALTFLLVLTVITITNAQTQYLDILQGLQQLFQPYQGNDYINQFNGATRAPQKSTNRHDGRKKSDHRHTNSERRTKKPPTTNQHDYFFATTEKISQKTTKSSHNNNSRSFNNKNENSNVLSQYYSPYEVTTKARVKATTTTEANYYNNQANRATTQYVFNTPRPVNGNVFGNVNNRETVTNGARPNNNNNNRPQSINDRNWSTTNNRGTQESTQYPLQQRPDNRNDGVLNTDYSPGFNNFGGAGVNTREVSNFNNNDRGNLNFNGNQNNFPTNKPTNSNANNNRGTSNFNTNDNRRPSILNTNNNGGTSNFNTNENRRPTNSNTNNNRGISNFNTNENRRPNNSNNNGGTSNFNTNDRGNLNFNANENRRPTNSNNNGGTLNFNANENRRPTNSNNNGGTSNFNTNDRGNLNFNTNENRRPGDLGTNNNKGTSNFNTNNRGTSNYNTNNRGTSNYNTNNRGTSNYNTNNRGTSNNNRAISNFNTNNNRGTANGFNANNWGNNFNPGGFYFPDNPLINHPGVLPAPVDIDLPPITNRPVPSTNIFGFNRPSVPSSVTFTDKPDREPEILIGPDEDDMTEWQKRRYEDQAERMCDYYKSLTIKKVVALPLIPSPDPVEVNVSDCTPINIPLVIGGSIATIQEFPHMALVGWTKVRDAGYSWKCGGSLISDRYVLSAGHCTYQDKDANVVSGPPQVVQLGSSYLDDPGALVVRIAAVIRHPKYKQRRSYHDVALIKMVTKVRFSEVIRPACLGIPPPVGNSIIATGWGRTEFGGDHSLQLRSVSLSVWDLLECREIWGTSLKLPSGVTPDSHMCAGERRGGKDTCQGDSGGPAQVQDGCVWRVVAVTSYGRSCGAPDTPALYAVVPHAFVAAQVFDDRS